MKISDIAEVIYPLLQAKVNGEKIISCSKTGEDVLNDVVLRAIKNCGEKDFTFDEGKEYLFRKLSEEIYFGYRKEDKIVLFPNMHGFEGMSEE